MEQDQPYFKAVLQQFATYHTWANDRVIDFITRLPPQLFDEKVRSSFTSLRQTVLHLCEAEYIWWQRVQKAENPVSPAKDNDLQVKYILDRWKQQSRLWQQWVSDAQDEDLLRILPYMNSRKERFEQPVYEVVLQVSNHGTYHRGQVITILRQLGLENLPNTDFITWSRNYKRERPAT
jgi:uncharacterized damage-inducible protein DinB